MATNSALIVGVTGIVGIPLAEQLIQKKWKVYGVSRRYADFLPSSLKHIALDATNKEDCQKKLKDLKDVTHVFFVAWVNAATEEERCKVNKEIVSNILEGLPSKLKHVVLQTGTKNYLGPFEVIAERFKDTTQVDELPVPFKESLPRCPYPNFYYDQEDILFEIAAKKGFTWSVARPAVIVGFAPKNQMNLGANIAVYASICKYLNLPFKFPGGRKAFGGQIFWDASDADLIAEHLIWEATTKEAANQAFNVVNGDVFKWKFLWPSIAEYFGLKVEEPEDDLVNMEQLMKDKEPVWDEIVEKHGLKKLKLSELTNWWFMQISTAGTISVLNDMTKSRELGFKSYISTEKSFFKLFDYMKKNKYIP